MSAAMQILEQLDRHARDMPDRQAIREVGGAAVSWRELRERVGSASADLKKRVGTGAVVMLCRANCIQFHVDFLGILGAGCSVFPVFPDAVESELVWAIEQSGANVVIGDRTLPARQQPTETSAAASDLLLQTSGTTGNPGIVRRRSASVDAVARNMVGAIGFSRDDHVLATLPLYHSYGLEHGLLAPLLAGSTIHLCRNFNLATVLTELTQQPITIFPGVPTIFEMLGELADDSLKFPSLRTAYSAGAVLPHRVSEKMREKFSIRVGQVYGTTEVGSVTFNDPHREPFDPGSVGVPMNGVEIRVLTMDGEEAPPQTEGHIHVRATSMFSGYVACSTAALGCAAETSQPKAAVPQFFWTGDVGKLIEGKLTITGRLKLLIDIGGFKVNPIEVAQMMLEHPGVGECVVIPIRMSETINRLKAVIIPRDSKHAPVPDELAQFARARLTAYKVPRIFEVRQTLPRTATGKVLRHLIETL